ncbi:hypothetical protein EJ02DRAFT_247085 [Clathrospora elynae]|uniref:Pentacotripeptide-repeat region of PRORP domain-containing protein n=1 Tax=Clathrospora elynae TaxID=706981 RepID=A0A6A5SJD5_9PLEO|nr:hypothetical protein EJ02DRAFT_247085 [Clathrospora elynae]
MPRVRLPNARLVASADLPLLPFLAPRVFAESPIPKRSIVQNGKSDGAQKEKETVAACIGGSRTTRPPSINHLYVDISSVARRHARPYATFASAVPRVAGGNRPSQRRAREPSPTRTSSALVQHSPVLAAKRAKALALERDRLANYLSQLPPGLAEPELRKHGQYRSLYRRISNLRHWDVTQLDLSDLHRGPSTREWILSAFAALDRALYPSVGRHTRNITIKHDQRCFRWSTHLFPPGTEPDLQQVWINWNELGIQTRRAVFQKLLIYLLDRKPGRALQFVQVLAHDPLLRDRSHEAIADALGHISKVHIKGCYGAHYRWGPDTEAHKRVFVPAFVHIFDRALAVQPAVCSQDLLYNLVELAGSDDRKKVFDCLIKHRTRLAFDTLLHYASAFGEEGEVHYALLCLDNLKVRHNAVAWASVSERQRLRWTCATILRTSMSKDHDYHQTPGIVASFVRLGIKMDILLYNVVMHNAMEAGDYTTAFKVYNTLESNELKPDKYTFSILLHGCTSQDNPAMFQSFAQYSAEFAMEIKDPWLATDFLYYLYVRHQADSDIGHTSALLWQAYASRFSVAPFQPFINHGSRDLGNASQIQRSVLESTVLSPTPVALYIMLQMEIRSALAISNLRVLNLYQKFKVLAGKGTNPVFRELTQNTTIWNAFLLAFCQNQQFESASQLIKDMTDGPTQPNIYSWNIFMQAFFKTGQIHAAERVFEIMRSRGSDPDQYTYGVLLRGYAKAQLVELVGDTMEHVETEQEMDPDLLRALAAVVNRQQLMITLEKTRLKKEARAKAKAEKKAEESRIRWQSQQFMLTDVESSTATTTTPSDDRPAESDTTVQ